MAVALDLHLEFPRRHDQSQLQRAMNNMVARTIDSNPSGWHAMVIRTQRSWGRGALPLVASITSFRSETRPEDNGLVPMVCVRTQVHVLLIVVVEVLSTGFAARTVRR